jgi:hypothetical protein
VAAGVAENNIYSDTASGKDDDRVGLAACLKALRGGDTLVVWKLDRLGRNLRHLVNAIHDLTARRVGLKVLSGHGAAIDTTTPAGKPVFGIFAALAEFERELICERTRAGLASARARGRKGGRRPKMTPAKLRLAHAAMGREVRAPFDPRVPEARRLVPTRCPQKALRGNGAHHVRPPIRLWKDNVGAETEPMRAFGLRKKPYEPEKLLHAATDVIAGGREIGDIAEITLGSTDSGLERGPRRK